MPNKSSINDDRVEDALLFYCARTTINEKDTKQIHALIRQFINWDFLIKSAIHHRVVPLLYLNLSRICPDFIPIQHLHELRYCYEKNARRNLFLTLELIKLIKLLETEKISAIPYKGPAIAFLAYGNICLRQFSDLDILVSPFDYLKTRYFLLQRGYRLAADYGWECSLVDDRHGVCIDLHKGITPERFSIHLDFQSIKNRLIKIPVGSEKINTPSPENMLIILCVQLAKDGCESKPLRLSKICDIAELIQTHPSMDWKRVFKEASRLGCQRILLVGLSTANRLLGTQLPDLSLQSLANSNLIDLINHIHNKLIHQVAPSQAGQLSVEDFYFKIRERWRDKLYPYYYDFKKRLVPNEMDHKFISLPESLNILYCVVRPIRLMGYYSQLAWHTLKTKCLNWK